MSHRAATEVNLRTLLPDEYRHTVAAAIPAEVVTAAFLAANDRLVRAAAAGEPGPTVLYVPPGRWRVAPSRRYRNTGIVVEAPGATLRGAGIRATVIELDSPAAAHVLAVRARPPRSGATDRVAPDGITIETLTLRGNRRLHRRKIGGHGIVARDNARHLTLRDVVVEDAPSNALGLERTDDVRGVFSELVLRNVVLAGSGRSAIDMKNYDADAPSSSATRSFLTNVAVGGCALAWSADQPQGLQYAFHIRGHRQFQNIDVVAKLGFWFVNEDHGPLNGFGAHYSQLENYRILMDGDRAIMAKAVTYTGSASRTRLLTDPRDVHDERILPLEGVRYWRWPDGGPRRLVDQDLTDPDALEDAWSSTGWRVTPDGLVPGRAATCLALHDAGTGDVSLVVDLGGPPASTFSVLVRADEDGTGLAVSCDGEHVHLHRASPAAGTTTWLATGARPWRRGSERLRVTVSGARLEVYDDNDPTGPLLEVDLPEDAPAGTHLGFWSSAPGAPSVRRIRVDSAPPPIWNGSVVVVDALPVLADEPAPPDTDRFVGSFDPSTLALDEVRRNRVVFEVVKQEVTVFEAEIKGHGAAWLGGEDGPVDLLVAAGPTAGYLTWEDGAWHGTTPLQMVQTPRHDQTPGGRTVDRGARHALRRWPSLVLVRHADRVEGTLTLDADEACTRRLALVFSLEAAGGG